MTGAITAEAATTLGRGECPRCGNWVTGDTDWKQCDNCCSEFTWDAPTGTWQHATVIN